MMVLQREKERTLIPRYDDHMPFPFIYIIQLAILFYCKSLSPPPGYGKINKNKTNNVSGKSKRLYDTITLHSVQCIVYTTHTHTHHQ